MKLSHNKSLEFKRTQRSVAKQHIDLESIKNSIMSEEDKHLYFYIDIYRDKPEILQMIRDEQERRSILRYDQDHQPYHK